MEKILTGCFEYQKFEKNPELQAVIDSVHARWSARELNLDEMECVAAAGNPEPRQARKKPENK